MFFNAHRETAIVTRIRCRYRIIKTAAVLLIQRFGARTAGTFGLTNDSQQTARRLFRNEISNFDVNVTSYVQKMRQSA
jgi:hypothetical protein